MGFWKKKERRKWRNKHCVALDERLGLRLDKVLLDIGDDVRHLHLGSIDLSDGLCSLRDEFEAATELECHLHVWNALKRSKKAKSQSFNLEIKEKSSFIQSSFIVFSQRAPGTLPHEQTHSSSDHLKCKTVCVCVTSLLLILQSGDDSFFVSFSVSD